MEQDIKEFVRSYQTRSRPSGYWREPLVAFASAHDPLFDRLRTIVTPSHSLPGELVPNAQTVIAYFIPFTHDIVASNGNAGPCSREWAQAYIETNRLIVELNEFLARRLREQNHIAASLPPTHNFDQEKLISHWSHKHVAYIAGLGRFGLHRMLITRQGCAGRLGSLTTDLEIEPTLRATTEYCLYAHDGSCDKCIHHCPVDALSPDSFDRHKCYSMLLANARHHTELGYADACGKCACALPCSFTNPVRSKTSRT